MKKQRSRKEWKRSGVKNRHHIVNKSRGGKSSPGNILIMDTERHCAWHFLFGNLSIDEVIVLLKRLRRLKQNPP